MTGVRARVRAELTAEIKRLSRQQIAAGGATQLSLRAVARELGMASSAMYRYFTSRDELFTELIIESYDELGAVVEAAAATCAADDFDGRWRAVARAARSWAIAKPADYALLFGTPIPGYAAPVDTIGPATRYVAVLVELMVDLQRAGRGPTSVPVFGPALHADYELLRARMGAAVNDELLLLGLSAWMNVFGAISFEVFGHLHNVLDQPGEHFDLMVDMLGARLLGTA